MLQHIDGHIMTKNEDENRPVLVIHTVKTSGELGGVIGDYIKNHMTDTNVAGLYRAKCELIKSGIGERGDTQNICLLADYGYMLVNAFVMYANAEPAIDEAALDKALNNIRFTFPTYTIRIPFKLGYKDMTGGEWNMIFYKIMNRLVNHGVNVEIWHNV